MLSNREIENFLRFAKATAVKAGQILRKKIPTRRDIRYKGEVNLVTAADLASEKFIINNIEKEFPKHSLLAEEEVAINRPSELRWIIDPLDGTTNFAHSFPFYCVSIALEYRGRIIIGAIYDPEREELFYASRNHGAFLNGKRIVVTPETRMVRSLLATGFPYDIGTSGEDNLDHFAHFAKAARGIRRPGSAALDLCYVACGRFDGFWELKLSPWDTAAGRLIVEEAGGRVTDFRGGKYSIYDKEIIASNGQIHKQMIKILSKKVGRVPSE
ncbi:MAG: inositol monophosphatase family protein [candidate division Zixibacteria bacterium]|nr:inositol monophosphatase family protein [candidate division Zixibacteria bacterium]